VAIAYPGRSSANLETKEAFRRELVARRKPVEQRLWESLQRRKRAKEEARRRAERQAEKDQERGRLAAIREVERRQRAVEQDERRRRREPRIRARNGRIELIDGRELKALLLKHLKLDILIGLERLPRGWQRRDII
jgi:hypothetical protein